MLRWVCDYPNENRNYQHCDVHLFFLSQRHSNVLQILLTVWCSWSGRVPFRTARHTVWIQCKGTNLDIVIHASNIPRILSQNASLKLLLNLKMFRRFSAKPFAPCWQPSLTTTQRVSTAWTSPTWERRDGSSNSTQWRSLWQRSLRFIHKVIPDTHLAHLTATYFFSQKFPLPNMISTKTRLSRTGRIQKPQETRSVALSKKPAGSTQLEALCTIPRLMTSYDPLQAMGRLWNGGRHTRNPTTPRTIPGKGPFPLRTECEPLGGFWWLNVSDPVKISTEVTECYHGRPPPWVRVDRSHWNWHKAKVATGTFEHIFE